MPQKIGMLLTYSNKRMAPPMALTTPKANPSTNANANAYAIGSKLARFNHSTTMQTIIRTPPGSCSSCGH